MSESVCGAFCIGMLCGTFGAFAYVCRLYRRNPPKIELKADEKVLDALLMVNVIEFLNRRGLVAMPKACDYTPHAQRQGNEH